MGQPREYACLGGGLFRLDERGLPSLAALATPEGRVLQPSSSTLRKAGVLTVAAYPLGTLSFFLSVVSVPGFALVWGPRWLLGRTGNVNALAFREPMNRWAYVHSLIVSLVLVVVTIYLARGGWIALRTWA